MLLPSLLVEFVLCRAPVLSDLLGFFVLVFCPCKLQAREEQSTIWYYQWLALVWPKMLSGFQQLGTGVNSQKTSKRPSQSVHFRWNLKRTFHGGLDWGERGYKCQLLVKISAISQLSVKFSAFRQLSVKWLLIINYETYLFIFDPKLGFSTLSTGPTEKLKGGHEREKRVTVYEYILQDGRDSERLIER